MFKVGRRFRVDMAGRELFEVRIDETRHLKIQVDGTTVS